MLDLDYGPFESPLPVKVQAAIGRVITCWGAVEHGLQQQVARAGAIRAEGGKIAFNKPAFLRIGLISGGTHPRAMLAQLYHLTNSINEKAANEIKTAGDKLLKFRDKRDDLAHLLLTPSGDDAVQLFYVAASRSNWAANKTYSITQMDGWTNFIKKQIRTIDDIGTYVSGWTWKQIGELEPSGTPPSPEVTGK